MDVEVQSHKYTVMHVGHSYDTQYHMVDNGISRNLSVTSEEINLGVYVTNTLKPSTQCLKAANKAMAVLRMVKRNFHRLDVEGFRIIYKGDIRPHLEYCV